MSGWPCNDDVALVQGCSRCRNKSRSDTHTRTTPACLVVATCLLSLCGGCRSIRFGESEEDRLLKERQTLSNAQAGYNDMLLNNPGGRRGKTTR